MMKKRWYIKNFNRLRKLALNKKKDKFIKLSKQLEDKMIGPYYTDYTLIKLYANLIFDGKDIKNIDKIWTKTYMKEADEKLELMKRLMEEKKNA